MMMSTFSIFDPMSSSNFSLNWLALLSIMILTPKLYWMNQYRLSWLYSSLMKTINQELMNNLTKKYFKYNFMFLSILWFIMINNLMGLIPYIFTPTSHMSITIPLSLPMWLLFLMFSWMKYIKMSLSHLVPKGTPMALSFFMVLIETTSILIRPITLSIRLAANMIAGHLLISLLSSINEKMPHFICITSWWIMILLTLEYAVAMIQSYVFMTLLSLYLNEVN